MRTDGQIRQKLKQILFRHRKKFVKGGMSCRPENCSHNSIAMMPRHTANKASLGVCRYVSSEGVWNNVICDSTLGGVRTAEKCPQFACKHTTLDLKADFDRQIGLGGEKASIGFIAQNYPDVAALIWALGGDIGEIGIPIPKEDILTFFAVSEEEDEKDPQE